MTLHKYNQPYRKCRLEQSYVESIDYDTLEYGGGVLDSDYYPDHINTSTGTSENKREIIKNNTLDRVMHVASPELEIFHLDLMDELTI